MNLIFEYVVYTSLSLTFLFTFFEAFRLHHRIRKNKKTRKITLAHKQISYLSHLFSGDAKKIMSPLSQKICLLNIKKHLLRIQAVNPCQITTNELSFIDKHLEKVPQNSSFHYEKIPKLDSAKSLKESMQNIALIISILKQSYQDGILKQTAYLEEVEKLKTLKLRLRLESLLDNAQTAMQRDRLGIANMHYHNALTLLSTTTIENEYLVKMRKQIQSSLDQTQETLDALLNETKKYDELKEERESLDKKYDQSGNTNMDDTDMIFNNKKMYYGE